MTEPNGFYYMRARYYDPNVGRFISEDPIGFEGGDVNLYAYVGNNPIMSNDPLGLCANISANNRNILLASNINLPEAYIKVEGPFQPYVAAGGLISSGIATTMAGGTTTVIGYGSTPVTGPAGFVVGTAGLVTTATGIGQVAVGLDIYVDQIRHNFNLPKWFDLIPQFDFFQKH
ncbi:MAG: RHS repeat-associated core domain-containing protein [Thermodesulfobacteriota bacterium]|nr:RHS repeat-associated core domain-containing protein [Thermodesulfobacteriota bacterium]